MAAAATAALAIMVVGLPLIAVGIDTRERSRERAVVGAEFAEITHDLLARLGALANWDASLRNLDNRFDPAWAQSNLTTPFAGDMDNRLVIALDGNDRVLFAREHAALVSPPRVAAAQLATAALLAKVRAAENARATPPHTPARPRDTASWVVDNATEQIQGRPYLVIASLVGADVGAVTQQHARAPVILICSDLQADILPGLQARLLLRDAVVGAATGRGAELPLPDAAGHQQTAIGWTPERPGNTMLIKALAPCGTAVAVLLAAIIFAYRQAAAGACALQESEARAHYLAFHDGLTGLPNRRLFNDRFQQLLSAAARSESGLAVLLIDLDRFKAVNDTYGHQCGDELIEQVGRRLAETSRDADTCARLGGDEFAILAPDTTATEAAALATRLLEALAPPCRLTVATVQPAVSIGICISQASDHSPADLLRQADLALYKAKDEGRGRYRFFEPEMDQALQDRRLLEADLREALAAGTLQIVYQPQFDSDRLVGVEALTRWNHPQRGAIPPSLFIPLAEECGLIAELGSYVLRRSGADSRLWPDLKVAVNVSAAQLRMPGFVRDLAALVRQTGIDPSRFELEITEGVLLTNNAHLQYTLASIRRMGFSLALDDFGTGYCSLSYLSEFPIDRIKIDRSFVAGLPENITAEAIIRAIIALAQALNVEVLAEGVETVDQKHRLESLGCSLMQGYLLGRPSEPAAVIALLAPAQIKTAATATSVCG